MNKPPITPRIIKHTNTISIERFRPTKPTTAAAAKIRLLKSSGLINGMSNSRYVKGMG